jgi:glycosyltransferase involved in cell wall biosynthesis
MRARRDKLAILHTPFYFDAFLVDCPTVITIHDLIPFIFPVYGFVHRETVKAAYRFSARCSTHIVTVSDSTEQDVLRLLGVPGGKVTTVHNGLDQDVFKPARCPDEATFLSQRYGIRRPYVLTMSASNWKTKNMEGALGAIETARDICSVQFQTVVIGSPTGLEQTGLREKLRDTLVTGPIPAPDLPKIYRNASVFISLSRYEGFGYPLAEAMSCGTPCITSSGGSLAEVAADGAIVVDGSDESKVAQVLADLLVNSERRTMLSQKALNRASAFALGTFAESLLNVYQKVYQRNH